MTGINIGVVFSWESKLPKFSQMKVFAEQEYRQRINNLSLWNWLGGMNSGLDKEQLLLLIKEKEESMLLEFRQLVEGTDYFEQWFVFNEAMPALRMAIRRAYLQNSGRKDYFELLKETGLDLRIFRKVLNEFYPVLKKAEDLYQLERLVDGLYWDLLEKTAAFPVNSSWRNFLKTLKKAESRQTEERNALLKEGFVGANEKLTELDEKMKIQAEAECVFVNKAVLDPNENLTAIRYLTRLKYIFYNLKVLIYDVSDNTASLLVNYDRGAL